MDRIKLRPFNGERDSAVAGSVEADLGQWHRVGQDVDVEVLTVLQAEGRQCKADHRQDQVKLPKQRKGQASGDSCHIFCLT